ncbi:MAG: hypothetical protein J7639_20290 [Paenibacillaceae bacterium]|nr:hypothetical protein [Paenibacillaceae bacterium]
MPARTGAVARIPAQPGNDRYAHCGAGSETLLLTQNALDYNVREPAVLARVHYPAYASELRRMAEETGTPLCDIGRVWEQRVGGATNMHLLLMNDGIHPGEAGHRLFAETLFDYLGIEPTK